LSRQGNLFDFLAEQLFLKDGRGDWQNLEPSPEAIVPFVTPFLQPLEPYLLVARRLVKIPA